MAKRELGVGKLCFYDRKVHKIVASTTSNFFISVLDEMDVAYAVCRHKVEPLITEVFSIGDRVKSQYTFQGKVTGFEEKENRVVCISDKIDSYADRAGRDTATRVRYAYKPHELEKIEAVAACTNTKAFPLEVGDVYLYRAPNTLGTREVKIQKGSGCNGRVALRCMDQNRILGEVPRFYDSREAERQGYKMWKIKRNAPIFY